MKKDTTPWGDLPSIDDLSWDDFYKMDPVTQGRIFAKGLSDIVEARGEIAPQLKELLDKNDFESLGRGFVNYARSEEDKLIRSLGKPFGGGEWPETIIQDLDLGETTITRRDQIERTQGENLLRVLRSLRRQ